MNQASKMMEALGCPVVEADAFKSAVARIRKEHTPVKDWADVKKGAKLITVGQKGNEIRATFAGVEDDLALVVFSNVKRPTPTKAGKPENWAILKKGEGIYEVILKQRDRDALEELIDRHQLSGVVETVAEIAFEKQEHIEQGDNGATGLSRSWGKDAKALDTLSARLNN